MMGYCIVDHEICCRDYRHSTGCGSLTGEIFATIPEIIEAMLKVLESLPGKSIFNVSIIKAIDMSGNKRIVELTMSGDNSLVISDQVGARFAGAVDKVIRWVGEVGL